MIKITSLHKLTLNLQKKDAALSTLKEGGVSGGVGDMFRSSGGLKSRGHFTAINKDPDPLPHQPHPEDPKWEKTEES